MKKRLEAWLRTIIWSVVQSFFDRYLIPELSVVRNSLDILTKRLEASQKLPCFVTVSGVDEKDLPVVFASGIFFMSKGDTHEFEICPDKIGIRLEAKVGSPFVIREALTGNRSHSWNRSRDGEPAFEALPIGGCGVGQRIRVQVRYPEDEST